MFNFISKLSLGAAIGVLFYAWSSPEVIAISGVLLGVSMMSHIFSLE